MEWDISGYGVLQRSHNYTTWTASGDIREQAGSKRISTHS